jgi:hypothetical protein
MASSAHRPPAHSQAPAQVRRQHRHASAVGHLPVSCRASACQRSRFSVRPRIACALGWPTRAVPGQMTGWCSQPEPGGQSSRGRSIAASMLAALRPVFAASEFTTPAVPAGLSWPRSMSTRVSRCASCGIPRSQSRWRSTPRYLTRPLRMRSGGSAMPWVNPLPSCPTMMSRPLLLYAAAVCAAQVFGNPVELRGLEPLAFWLQTRRSSS